MPGLEAGWTLTVDGACHGWRLDRFLAHRITRLSRARAARLQVTDLDMPNRRLKKSSSVHSGQRLFAARPIPDDAPTIEPTILHTDDDLLVLEKPAGLAAHPTASRFRSTVTYWLHSQGFEGVEPAHRLDVETSGVLLCTRGLLAAQQIKKAFAARTVKKNYRAVVEGQPPEMWTDDTSLGFAKNSAVRLKMGRGDLSAETAFRVIDRGPHRALVEARPISGRQHQIRCHLALAGHPIVGDKLYGPDESFFLAHLDGELSDDDYAHLGHHRHALHAMQMTFTFAGKVRSFESTWPAELAVLLQEGP